MPLFEALQRGGERHPHHEAGGRDQGYGNREFQRQRQAHTRLQQGRNHSRQQRHQDGDQNQRAVQAAVVVRQDSPAEIATQAARYQHREDHHRERVGGVSQEKHELLDQGHFDQNVARADANEIEQVREHTLVPRQARAQHHGRQCQDDGSR